MRYYKDVTADLPLSEQLTAFGLACLVNSELEVWETRELEEGSVTIGLMKELPNQGAHVFKHERGTWGVCLENGNRILVDASLGAKDLIQVVAHEVRHAWQARKHSQLFCAAETGDERVRERLERDAAEYADSWTRRIMVPKSLSKLVCVVSSPEDQAAEMPHVFCWREIAAKAFPAQLYCLDIKGEMLWEHRGSRRWLARSVPLPSRPVPELLN